MNTFSEIINNSIIHVALIGWFFAQALKIPINFLVERTWDFSRFYGSGGMPSSHSSMVVATSLMIGTVQGFDSAVFALSVVISSVVMYDASGVRQEAGKQAAVINRIINDFIVEGKEFNTKELKELIGHTNLEVLGGFIVGVLSWWLYIVFFY